MWDLYNLCTESLRKAFQARDGTVAQKDDVMWAILLLLL